MRRGLALLIFILLSTLACSLDWSDDPTPLPSPTPFVGVIVPVTNAQPTQTTAPTRTPAPTATSMSSSGSNSNPAPVANCSPRTDWPVYTVVRGDTLATIAQRTGSTVNQLTQANCLSNPNLIEVGKGLRVPRLPAPVPTWTPAMQRRGAVQIGPYLAFTNNIYTLQANATVTVAWPDGPGTGAQAVEFVFVPDGAAYGIQIGMDTNMADGAAVAWVVPTPITGRVYASGRLAGQNTPFIESNSVAVLTGYPEEVVYRGKVVVNPYLSFQNDQYGVVEDTTLTLSWPEAVNYGLGQVQFILYFPGTNQNQLLGTDNNMADGATIQWRIPKGVAGQIVANGFYPGQIRVSVASNGIGIQAQQKPAPTDPGKVKVEPSNSFDGTTYVVTAGSTVTLSWPQAPFNQIGKVEFVYESVDGGTTLVLGSDQDFSDNNANITWTVPAGTSGTIRASCHLYETGEDVSTNPVSIKAE